MFQCFHCDAPNFEDCYKIGKYMDCAENEGACMVEIRERDGKLESVCMGCKQIRACKAQKGNLSFTFPKATYKTVF